MRVMSFVCLALAPLAACTEPDTETVFAQVTWMEWPAEVLGATPFTVRLIGWGDVYCREVEAFRSAPAVDHSAVTFEPYFLVTNDPGPCPILERWTGPDPSARGPIPILPPYFDTRSAVPGLDAQQPRSYELRAAADVQAPAGELDAAPLPVRTFGEVIVRSDAASTARTNAGGSVYAYRDSVGCVELYAGGVEYVIENPPADTASFWSAFVRGYLHTVATPVCGEARVFHLVSRN